ncbi:hypothetical protein MUK42_06027 [Musa troglodytarum]|uniref:Uncharacterized protein n=1 Tax=Musa troglodytarum TaxID=320322 RepID=A0A9E7KHL9_9LILI|nr:hypothetical protein MUK42_06027 [Musa troglodytarum]
MVCTLASGNDTKVVVVVVVKWETVLLQALINSTTPFKSTSLPSRSNWTKNAQKVSVACSSNSKAMAVRINYRRKEGLPATGVITCRRWRKGEESSGERERVHGFVVSSEDSPSCGVAACRYVLPAARVTRTSSQVNQLCISQFFLTRFGFLCSCADSAISSWLSSSLQIRAVGRFPASMKC